MKELKKFNVLSVGKVFGLFGFVVSIIQMIFLKLISVNPAFALQYGMSAGDFTFKIMVLGVVSATAIYFISGLVIALIYNMVARYAGGVMFDLGDVKAVKKKRR
jgi:hypothetical protein